MTDQVSTRDLEKFAKEIADQLAKLRSRTSLDKETKKHQKNLEALLKNTQKIVKNQASDAELRKFDDLLATSELSYDLMKDKAAKDEKFQEEYVAAFGKLNKHTSLAKDIFAHIAVTLQSVKESVGVMRESGKQDIKDTALDFFTGPFGKMFKENVDFHGIKDAMAKRFGKNKLAGQAHDGMDRIPREGTYMLDGGERVLSPNQNNDLTSFLKKTNAANDGSISSQKEPIEVFNTGHEHGYFDSIVKHDEQLHSEEVSRETKWNRNLMTRLTILGELITGIGNKSLANMIIAANIWWKRFSRHPILNSMSLAMMGMWKSLTLITKPLTGMFINAWQYLFGKKKSDTDRIVESNQDIVTAIKGEKIESKQSRARRFMSTLGNVNLTGPNRFKSNVTLAQEAEDHRAAGGELSKKQQKLLNKHRDTIGINTNRVGSDSTMGRQYSGENKKLSKPGKPYHGRYGAHGLLNLQIDWYREWKRGSSGKNGKLVGNLKSLGFGVLGGLGAWLATGIKGGLSKSFQALKGIKWGKFLKGSLVFGWLFAGVEGFMKQGERSVEEIQARGGFWISAFRDIMNSFTFGLTDMLAKALAESDVMKPNQWFSLDEQGKIEREERLKSMYERRAEREMVEPGYISRTNPDGSRRSRADMEAVHTKKMLYAETSLINNAAPKMATPVGKETTTPKLAPMDRASQQQEIAEMLKRNAEIYRDAVKAGASQMKVPPQVNVTIPEPVQMDISNVGQMQMTKGMTP